MTLAHKVNSDDIGKNKDNGREDSIAENQIYTIHTFPDEYHYLSEVPNIGGVIKILEQNEYEEKPHPLYGYSKKGITIKVYSFSDESETLVHRVHPDRIPETGGIVLYDSQTPPSGDIFSDLPNLYVDISNLILEIPASPKLESQYKPKFWKSLVSEIKKELKDQ